MKLFFGALFIFVFSPAFLWAVGSQDAAQDFSNLTQADAEIVQDGPLVIYGQVQISQPVSCPDENQCVYSATQSEIYTRSEFIACGELDENLTVLKDEAERCDNTGNCEPCFLVESFDWELQESTVVTPTFNIGAYTITPSPQTQYLDVIVQSDAVRDTPKEGDVRTSRSYLPLQESMLAAGTASSGVITNPTDSGQFFISNLSIEDTQTLLKQQDKVAKNSLRLLSLLSMIVGWVVLISQFTRPISGLFKILPILGPAIERGSNFALTVLSALIGLVVWLVIFLPLSFIQLF